MARLVFFIVCLNLAGCGTDVRELLRDDNQLAWEVEEAVASAEDAGSGLDRDMQRAEVAKMDACKEIYEATNARMEREMSGDGLSFTEQFWADLRLLVIRLFPIPSVEHCAEAQADYIAAYESLRERLAQAEATPLAAD